MEPSVSTPAGPTGDDWPDVVWYEVFQRCNYKTINEAEKACSQFTRITDDNGFWRDHCERDGITLPPTHAVKLAHIKGHDFDYRYLYSCADTGGVDPYGQNILRDVPVNPAVAEAYGEHWMRYHTRNCTYESPPVGYNATPEMPTEALATSFIRGFRSILVNLEKAGIEPWVLDKFRPAIVARERHAPRFDCSAVYNFAAQVRKEDEIYPHTLVRWLGKPDASRGDIRETHYPQWAKQPWKTEEIRIADYGFGMRNVLVSSTAKDNQFWAGNYGMKFTDTELQLVFAEKLEWNDTEDAAPVDFDETLSEPDDYEYDAFGRHVMYNFISDDEDDDYEDQESVNFSDDYDAEDVDYDEDGDEEEESE
ncbi:unnamed protein product, partial [Mesorhabditis spiculigera]